MSTESVSASVGLVTGAGKGIGLETARRLAGGTGGISPHAAASADGPVPRPPARGSWNWT
jgi:hypothetical protein